MVRFTVTVRADRVDEALDVLLALLPAGVHQRDGRSGAVELVALCDRADADGLAEALGDLALAAPETVPAGDLATELDRLRPVVEVGRVVVRPAAVPPSEGRVDVVIASRRFGFGTGAHPTTRLCLQLLQGLSPAGSFADLGCGAGAILIAAAKLGFSPVVGADHSALALQDARENCAASGIEADLLALDLARDDVLPDVRTAVANVGDMRVHARLAEAPLETVIVSGLRGGEIDAALRAYDRGGFVAAGGDEEKGWAAVTLRRASGGG